MKFNHLYDGNQTLKSFPELTLRANGHFTMYSLIVVTQVSLKKNIMLIISHMLILIDSCPADVTVVADPVTMEGTFQFNINGDGHQLQLPIGKYPYKFRSKDGAMCTLHVTVLGNTQSYIYPNVTLCNPLIYVCYLK